MIRILTALVLLAAIATAKHDHKHKRSSKNIFEEEGLVQHREDKVRLNELNEVFHGPKYASPSKGLTTEKPESENIIDTDEIKSKEGRCEKERQTCETLRCPYGVERYYVAETGCEDCRCHNPCRDHQCEDGMRCAPELYRGEGGETAVRASCRLGFGIDSANLEHNKLSIIGDHIRPVDPENKYPWMAALMTVKDNFNRQFCGGSVIHEMHVVTAASCVGNIDPVRPPRNTIFVRLGEHRLSIQTGNEQDFTVDKIMIHERYYNNISSGDNNNTCNMEYDIAILRLSEPILRFPRIPLPMDWETIGNDVDKARVIGWGYTDIEEYKTIDNGSDILLQRDIHIRKSDHCKRHFHGYKDTMMICTRETAGKGDSGGPLMIRTEYEGEMKIWLIGIVSFSVNHVSIFVRTSYFIRWIYDILLWG